MRWAASLKRLWTASRGDRRIETNRLEARTLLTRNPADRGRVVERAFPTKWSMKLEWLHYVRAIWGSGTSSCEWRGVVT